LFFVALAIPPSIPPLPAEDIDSATLATSAISAIPALSAYAIEQSVLPVPTFVTWNYRTIG